MPGPRQLLVMIAVACGVSVLVVMRASSLQAPGSGGTPSSPQQSSDTENADGMAAVLAAAHRHHAAAPNANGDGGAGRGGGSGESIVRIVLGWFMLPSL